MASRGGSLYIVKTKVTCRYHGVAMEGRKLIEDPSQEEGTINKWSREFK